MIRSLIPAAILLLVCSIAGLGQDGKAEAVIAKAVQSMGGARYLSVTSQVGRGSFSSLRQGGVVAYQNFTDVIVFPDKERTEFKGTGSRSTQVNTGDTGWIYDGDQDLIKVQTPVQIANFKRALRTSLDSLLRGYWKGQATLSYVGRRQGGIGKRNDVVKLTYSDGFTVEFEFADDGMPVKALYTHKNAADEDIKDEDRYAQFVDIDGIKTPFIIDRFESGEPVSRINYESVEFNKRIPDSAFAKPASVKEAKKSVNY
jgi:outer membrane lipoprotein-sorting protein